MVNVRMITHDILNNIWYMEMQKDFGGIEVEIPEKIAREIIREFCSDSSINEKYEYYSL